MGKGAKEKETTALESELQDLQRKYRIMEGDRLRYSEESQNLIRKQRATIEKLRKENEQLREEVTVYTRQFANMKMPNVESKMNSLSDQIDTLTRKIELERKRSRELDNQTKVLTVKILDQRSKMGGCNAARENQHMIEKQIRVLENRLDKQSMKFNEGLGKNKELREKIDNLRRERVIFDDIYKQLEKELHEKKKEMALIIEQSNLAYEERDTAQSQLGQLKVQAEKEFAEYEEQYREIEKKIEQDRKMKDFMKQREKPRTLSEEEEQRLKRKVIKGAWGVAKEKAQQQISTEKVQSYEEAFMKIQQATGITDIDELVTNFINAEDKNFSLFNYVNELNNEIEKTEEQINDLKSEIERYKGQDASSDSQRKKILKELEEKLEKTQMRSEQYELRYGQAVKTLTSLRSGIESIFAKIGCDAGSVAEILGSEGVTEGNMMQYLGIIEQRTNELLQLYAQQHGLEAAPVEAPSPGAASPTRGNASFQNLGGTGLSTAATAAAGGGLGASLGPSLPPGAAAISINPPSTGGYYESDEETEEDDDERPLTRGELKERSQRLMAKREKKGAMLDGTHKTDMSHDPLGQSAAHLHGPPRSRSKKTPGSKRRSMR